jgi:hypothetical protein
MSIIVRRIAYVLMCGLVTTLGVSAVVYAETLQSSGYRFEESAVGTGGQLQSNSANYQATSSTGDIANGDTSSTNYQATGGTRTSPDPALTFAITSSSANFGTFSAATASTATTSFSVINYTTYGYVVQVVGPAPTNGSHAITALTSGGASSPGNEQFGINLVANTSPVSQGANPNNGQFGFGSAAINYNTPNTYRYVSGETIASAIKNSGQTDYTISYLVNVGPLTQGGQYSANQTLIVVGTY